MGVANLLPFVSTASSEVHISRFRGQRVAIDASSWLYRGAVGCASKLAHGHETQDYLKYPLAMVQLLQDNDVTPFLVFDGAKLPMKARTDMRRSSIRAAQLDIAKKLMDSGERASASAAIRRSVSVTPEMGRQLINILQQRGIPYVVAPYEADAQIVFLVINGYCNAAISEDSDLLAYGCPHTVFKLDRDGHGRLVSFDNLQYAVDAKTGRALFDGSWKDEWEHWKHHLFRAMCILAGCDYLAGIPGVGIKTAYAALRTHREVAGAVGELLSSHEGIASQLGAIASQCDGTLFDQYMVCFEAAQQVFEQQLVWDPSSRTVIPLRPRKSPEIRGPRAYLLREN
ncbi:hypothetical protein AB1Y20_021477 [Prymnesium parvum]|uniref:Exonuclease 1 n=1 Tax=Prymnesium parvum TaxID=97485 RepID=A0AB34JIS7_PRYPA